MQTPSFEECIHNLRSKNPEVYENAYQYLQSYLNSHLNQITELMLAEKDPDLRSKFLELLGDSQNKSVLDIIENELRHPDSLVRSWAYTCLQYHDTEEAQAIASKFSKENPNEDFL